MQTSATAGGRKILGLAILAPAAAMVVTGFFPGSANAGDPPGGKVIQRQVRIMERVVDEMLIDSPNWLVSGRDDTRGYYIPGHGAIFSFDATLVGSDWSGSGSWSGLRALGRHMGFFWNDDEDDWDRDRDRESDDRGDAKDRDMRDRYLDREARRYEHGKQEVVDVLLDFGDVLEGLKDDEWVTIVAYLGNADYFYDEDLENLVVKGKMRDLKAYAGDKVKRDEMMKRITIEEY
jgi:hypothetical protein